MYCAYCGKEMNDDPNVCSHCGATYKTEEETAPVEVVEETAPVEVVEETAPVVVVEETAPVEVAEEVAPVEIVEEVAPVEVVEETAPVEVAEEAAPVDAPQPVKVPFSSKLSGIYTAVIKTLGIAALTLAAIAVLALFVFAIVLSFMDYMPFKGIFESAFGGAKWYKYIFSDELFRVYLINTVIIGGISLACGSIYIFVSSIILKAIKNPWVKATLALVFVLPCIVSPILTPNLFGMQDMNSWVSGQLMPGVLSGCISASFFVICALFMRGKGIKSVLKLCAVFALYSLARIFVSNYDIMSLWQSAESFGFNGVVGTYAMELQRGSISPAAAVAVEVSQVVLNLIPTAIAALLIALMLKNRSEAETRLGIGPIAYPSIVSAIAIAVVALSVFVIQELVVALAFTEYTYELMINSNITSAISCAIITVFAILIACGAKTYKGCGMIIAILAMLLICEINNACAILMAHTDVYDTLAGLVICNLKYIPFFAFVFAVAFKLNETLTVRAFVLPAIALVFAKCYAAIVEPSSVLYSDWNYTLSLAAKNWHQASGIANAASIIVISVIIPFIVCAAGIFAGALIDARVNKKEKVENAEELQSVC